MRFPYKVTDRATQKNFDFLQGQLSKGTVPFVRTLIPTTVSVLDLGAIDGESITGVRISFHGRNEGIAANTVMRIKPNGLATVPGSSIAQRAYWPINGPLSTDAAFGGNTSATQPGLAVLVTDWGRLNAMSFEGTLFTKTSGVSRRHWLGSYGNQDIQVDQSNFLTGRIYSYWDDATTPITSLTLSIDAGTFTGRVCIEIIP